MSKAAELAALIGSQTALSNRNLIINGAMQVDQRNSGSSVTFDSGGTTSGFSADRHTFFVLGTGELDLACQQVSDAPAGFANSLKVTVSTAESSGATPAADDRASLQMRLEGHSVERLALGTSDAKTFVLSFYVKSSLTGNHGVVLASNVDRSYPVLYNIASANTWERKTIVVPGPTDGTWGTDANYGFAIKFGFYTGSSRDGADQGITGSGTWITNTTAQGVTNQVQFGGTLNATWQITGIQLEVGEQATPFEHRSFGDELARCQRYFETNYPTGSALGTTMGDSNVYGISYRATAGSSNYYAVPLKVKKRSSPTVTIYNGVTGGTGTWRGSGGLDRSISTGTNSDFFTANGVSNNDYIRSAFYAADSEL